MCPLQKHTPFKMINQLLKQTQSMMNLYEIPSEIDKLQMMYFFGKIEVHKGYDVAYESLVKHLETHYTLKDDLQSKLDI